MQDKSCKDKDITQIVKTIISKDDFYDNDI